MGGNKAKNHPENPQKMVKKGTAFKAVLGYAKNTLGYITLVAAVFVVVALVSVACGLILHEINSAITDPFK